MPLLPLGVSLASGLAALLLLFLLHRSGLLKRPVSPTGMFYALIVLVGITIPMTMGMLQMAGDLLRYLFMKGITFISLANALYFAALAAVLFFILKGRFLSRLSTGKFLAVVLLCAFAAKMAYILLVRVDIPSGAMYLWKKAVDVASYGFEASFAKASQARVLPYFAPLLWIFGLSLWVIKIANVVTSLVCSLISFELSRRWFGERVGRSVLITTLLVPETFAGSVITTHDIPGALYFLVSLLLLDRLVVSLEKLRWRSCVLLAVLLGISVTLMDIQRDLLPFWVIAIILCIITATAGGNISISLRRNAPSRVVTQTAILVALLLLPSLFVSAAVKSLPQMKHLIKASKESTDASLAARWLIGNGNSWATGSYHNALEYYTAYRPLGNSEVIPLALHTMISDTYYNPADRLLSYFTRAKHLYSLGSQLGRYFQADDSLQDNAVSVKRIKTLFKIHNTLFVLFFESAFVICFILFFSRQWRLPFAAQQALLSLSFLSALLLLFGEYQPRYMYPLWYVAPIFFFSTLDHIINPENQNQIKSELKASVIIIIRGFLIITATLCLSFSLFYVLAGASDRKYLDFSEWSDFRSSRASGESPSFLSGIQPPSLNQRRFRLLLQLPQSPLKGDRVSVEHSYETEDALPRTFEVYVHSPHYENPGLSQEEYRVSIFINGTEAHSFILSGEKSARPVRVKHIFPKDHKNLIKFILEAVRDDTSQRPREATTVIFDFPRLMREKG